MKTLEHNQLLEYLRHAIKLESAVVAQNQIIEKHNEVSKGREPMPPQKQEPEKPQRIYAEGVNDDNPFGSLVCYGLGGFLCLFGLIQLFSGNVVGGLIAIGIGAILLALALIPEIEKKKHQNYLDEQYNQYYKRYEDACALAEVYNQMNAAEYRTNMEEWKKSRDKANAYLNSHLEESKQTLETFYQQDVIYPKYRNLAALTSIYEYLESGRCSELTGPQGAYNLYEDELRKNIVIAQLNTIIAQLEQIRYNQYMLYEEVRQIQANTQRIASEMRMIRGYTYVITELTALNTYYAGIAAANSTALAYCRSL